MTEKIVEPTRRFSPISSSSLAWDYLEMGNGHLKRWRDIDD